MGTNVLDGLVPLIDNGGTRTGAERRRRIGRRRVEERRMRRDRRSGADRRRTLNAKRSAGIERRTVFTDFSAP